MIVRTVQNGNKVVATARIGGTSRQATVTVPEFSSDERKHGDAHATAVYNLLKKNLVVPEVKTKPEVTRRPSGYEFNIKVKD